LINLESNFMTTTSKIIITVIVIVVLAPLIWTGVRIYQKNHGSNHPSTNSLNGSSTASQSQSSSSGQSAQTGNQPKSNQTSFTGCPNGQDIMSTDSNGRFKPTIDIANKQAVLNTSMGKIVIDLYDKDAPKTVENFVCLIQQNYYNGIIFHRVAHGFVIQGGDPTGTGTGGKSVYGPTFEDELYPDTASYQAGYLKGVLAMANAGPNTNGSQFFILLADHPELPHNYTIFGKVASGQDVVDKIGSLPVTPVFGPDDGTPTTKVTINSASVISK